MIGEEQGFTEDGLAVTPGDFDEEIGLGILYEVLHGFQIGAEVLDAGVPGRVARRGSRFWPVVVRPFRSCVIWVAAEFQDVPLREAQVFEEHPQGVRVVGGFLAAEIGGDVGDDVVESGVGLAALKKLDKVGAERFVLIRHV